MADNRKEQERAELHRTIWNIANDLRGSVDGWDFKQYVLGILFYRYISENITAYINKDERETGDLSFDYAALSDEDAEQAREDMVKTRGFFILPSELFINVRSRAASDENLNKTLEKVFTNIEASAKGADSEDDFKGLFDDIDVNSNKLGGTIAKRNERLVKLLNGVSEMTQQMARQIFESIKEVLDDMDFSYEQQRAEDGNYTVIFDYRGEDARHRMMLRVLTEPGILTLSEVLAFNVEEGHLPALLDALNRINANLLLGTFYFDYDGSVIFYNALLFNNSMIAKDTINELMIRTVSIIEKYDDRLAAVNKGYLLPERVTGD